MSGGFTLSGGEPRMQDRFAVKLLTAAKGMGIHTALDTNGGLGARLSNTDLEHIDLVLRPQMLESRTPSQANRHGKWASAGFARRLAARKTPIWLRYVLVPGLTDDAGDIAQLAEFSAALGNIQRVDVLPFHQMGRFKWKELKLNYTLEDVQLPSIEVVERVCAQFRGVGLKAN
jgi:pyruvate formate lyase activating enzyme